MSPKNLAASVRQRLLNRARERGEDFSLTLTRFSLERLLYRLSISRHRDHYLLKGALLFDLWFDEPHRPTRDADLLGFGDSDIEHIAEVFREVSEVAVDDGMVFDPGSIKVAEIRKEANYAGLRVTLLGELDGARCPVQVDIGFGDAVTPGPVEEHYPKLIEELDAPHLRVYPRYSVIAEKFEAIVSLGMANSRLKDYFDLWVLANYSELDGATLQQAIAATFERRKTAIPEGLPLGLTDEFTKDPGKETQWKAFLRKNGIDALALDVITQDIVDLIFPVLVAISEGEEFSLQWSGKKHWYKL